MADTYAQDYVMRLLRVDLSEGAISREELEPAVARAYLGGCALGARIMYDEVPAGIPWSDPRNRFMVLTGPLTGTRVPGSGGYTVCAQGALTGGTASTQAQGVFGAYLRFCGLNGLVFQGASQKWVYLLIDQQGDAHLRDASHLVGKDTWETEEAIVQELGRREREVSVVSIGPAGENLVRWASVMGDKGHAAAHNGVGAVMGSKKLKAIVLLRGEPSVPVRDRARLADVAKAIIEPVIARGTGVHYYGTLNGVQSNYARGNLPVKNYTTDVWEISEEQFAKFSGPYMHEHFEPKRIHPCWACPNRHCHFMTITEGPYSGMVVEEPEYEQLSAFSANLGINEVASVMMLANTVDRLGLDTNEAGWVLSCAMECYERGILTAEDTGGLELTWGNVEAVREMLHRIARREGVGDILAEGVARAVREMGRGAEEIGVYTVKGATPRGHDHRGRWTEMFDTCVSESGALDNTLFVADLTQFGLPAQVNGFDPDMLAKAEARMKGAMQFEDSLVTCRFNTRMNVKLLSEAVSAVTGWSFTFEEAMQVGRRAVNLMRAFNIRNGITNEMDRPSPRYGSTPTDGPAAGQAIAPHFDRMLQQYYALMGWDETGKPLPETLKAVGLDKVASDLWEQNSP